MEHFLQGWLTGVLTVFLLPVAIELLTGGNPFRD
jgi:hypothetical protein